MPYTDKQLTCVECGEEFTFTASEQERFAELGFTNEPKRCSPCRAEKKRRAGGGGGGPRADRGGPKEMHETKCAGCGGIAKVPFKPREDRPVYCSDCFSKRR
jgi:CxxC-x17-CxxC domain-containing protein